MIVSSVGAQDESRDDRKYFYKVQGEQVAARLCELLSKYFNKRYQPSKITLRFEHQPESSFDPDDRYLFVDSEIGEMENLLAEREYEYREVLAIGEPTPDYESDDPHDLAQYHWDAQQREDYVRAQIDPEFRRGSQLVPQCQHSEPMQTGETMPNDLPRFTPTQVPVPSEAAEIVDSPPASPDSPPRVTGSWMEIEFPPHYIRPPKAGETVSSATHTSLDEVIKGCQSVVPCHRCAGAVLGCAMFSAVQAQENEQVGGNYWFIEKLFEFVKQSRGAIFAAKDWLDAVNDAPKTYGDATASNLHEAVWRYAAGMCHVILSQIWEPPSKPYLEPDRAAIEKKWGLIRGHLLSLPSPDEYEVEFLDGSDVLVAELDIERAKALALLRDRTAPGDTTPCDLIPMGIALQRFRTSRSTLNRAVKAGTVKSYRPDSAPGNSEHQFSESELAQRYEKQQA